MKGHLLVFYCPITSQHKLSGLKQHRCHSFFGSRVSYDIIWFFLSRSHQAAVNLSVNQAAFSSVDLTRGESTPKTFKSLKVSVLFQAVGPSRASVPGLSPHSLPCNLYHKLFTQQQLVSLGPVGKQERLQCESALNLIFLNRRMLINIFLFLYVMDMSV